MNNERIDYKHFASKYTYGTGQGPVVNWTKAELKILLDEINRCYERLDKANEAMLSAREVLKYHYDIFCNFTHTTDLQDEAILDAIQALSDASE